MLKTIAVKPVVTASVRMTITEAARAMRAKSVGALVVVNAGRPLGILTDRDIVMDVVARGNDPDSVLVGAVMHKKPAVIPADAGLLDAVQLFAKTGVRRLPVVDQAGQVIVIIALEDRMIWLGNELGHGAAALTAGLRRRAS